MSEMRKSIQKDEQINIDRAFWGSMILTVVGFSSFVLGLFMIARDSVWQVYGVGLVATVSMLINIACVVLIRRGQATLSLKLLFLSGLVTITLNTILLENVTTLLIGFMLLVSLGEIFFLFPKAWRNRALFGPFTAMAVMLLVEFLNPSFRFNLITVAPFFGQIMMAFMIVAFLIVVFRQTWGRSMRNKLLVAFIGVTVVATSFLAIFSGITTNNILQGNLEREMTEGTIDRATRIGDLLNKQINALTTLSLNQALQVAVATKNESYPGSASEIQATLDANDERWRAADVANNNNDFLVQWHLSNVVAQELIEYQQNFPSNVEVFITDVYGGLAGATNRTSDYYQADEDWWQAAYNEGEGAVYISDPEFDESAGAVGVQIALPVRDQNTGEITGILRSTYIMSPLETILAEKVGQTGEADLYIPGEVVNHFHKGELGPAKADAFEALQAVANQGLVEMEYEGVSSVVAQAQVQTLEGNTAADDLDWVVVIHQQQDEAFAPLAAGVRGLVIVSLVVLALAVAAAFVLSLVLVRPITRLTQTAEEIAEGKIDTQAEVTSSDEVGTLAAAFNTMTGQLREFIGTLERRVEDRTKAITTSSAVSRRLSTILNRNELVGEVVNQVNEAFGFYHAHIYLLEDDELVMAGGTGDVGAIMLAEGHKIPKGRGLVGRAAEDNNPVLVSDTLEESAWLPNPLLPETKSEIAVPISVGDQVLGVLDVQHNVTNGLGQEDVDALISIANQVAIAMQNIESAETVAKRAKELETVAAISTATATIQDTFEMLATMVHLTQRGFDLYHAHVFEYHENTKELQIVACGYKEGDKHEGTHGTSVIPLAQEQSLVARAARTRQPVIVNDAHNEPGWLPNPLLPDTRAELAVPMIVGDRLLGVLDVQSEHLDAFTQEDANIQMTLASQVATALQNVRSFADAQKQAERETRLNTIAQKIQNTTTIEEAMQITARELGQALGKRQTLVALDPTALAGDSSKKVVNE